MFKEGRVKCENYGICSVFSCALSIDKCILDICIKDVGVDKDVLVNFAWVTPPVCSKSAKHEINMLRGLNLALEVGARRCHVPT